MAKAKGPAKKKAKRKSGSAVSIVRHATADSLAELRRELASSHSATLARIDFLIAMLRSTPKH